jgi:hypothetical protein
MHFYLVNPFIVNNMAMGRPGTKGPDFVGDKGNKFSTHGSFPPRIISSLAIASRLKLREDRVKTEERILGVKE